MSEDELYYTDMAVGDILRRTREHYGQSLTDIERTLRIRASQIEAIESGDIERLPGRVYAIGFVRTYSEYLGLDGNKMVHLFKIQMGAKTRAPELHFPVSPAETRTPPLWLALASIGAVIVLVAGVWITKGGERAVVNEIPEVPAAMQTDIAEPPAPSAPPQGEAEGPPEPGTDVDAVVTAPAAQLPKSGDNPLPVPVETAPVAAPGSAAPSTDIILNIVANSWVEIRDSEGKTIVSRVLKAGDQYYVPDRPDLKMSLGNAAGVRLEVGGEKLAPLGGEGKVLRNIALDAAALKKAYTKKVE